MLPLSQTMSRHAQDFIDDARLEKLAGAADLVDVGHLREVIAKSLGKEALSVEETAVLLHTRDRELREEVLGAAASSNSGYTATASCCSRPSISATCA